MKDAIEIRIKEQELVLLPTGGVFHRVTETLFVTDTHFGKDATFRKHSIPVPSGSTRSTISKITTLLQLTSAKQLIILGDMFHASSSLSDNVVELLDQFTISAHPGLKISLIPGNHDQGIRDLPEQWGINRLEPITTWDGLTLSHFPIKSHDHISPVLCGHVHPAVRVGSTTDQLKLPCFFHRGNHLILPAIGEFTGTKVIQPKPKDRVWVLADEKVIPWKI